MPARLGILGGTFDPVHFGHLRLAEEAAQAAGLDRVLLIPSAVPPHRALPGVSANDRLAMVELAIAGNDRLATDDRECRRAGPSYTVDTLAALRTEHPDAALYLLMGADAFLTLPTWSRWQQIFELAHVLVAQRPGYGCRPEAMPEPLAAAWRGRLRLGKGEGLAGSVIACELTPLEISASAIRREIARGGSARYLLPDAVLAYIQAHDMYRGADAG